MARRFPLTTTVQGVDASPYRALAPAILGQPYSAASDMFTAAADTWHNRTAFTVGMLHYPIWSTRETSNESQDLYHNLNGTSGFRYSQFAGLTPGQNYSRYQAAVGSTALNNGLPSGEVDWDSGKGQRQQGGLRFNVMVCDNDEYPDDLWVANGRDQSEPGQTSPGWSSAAAAQQLRIGLAGSVRMYDPVVAFFIHEEPMSREEVIALQANVLIAQDIPNVDFTGIGTVPDYIWSVKRWLNVGDTVPLQWVSDGAGLTPRTLNRVATGMRVIDLGADLLGT